MPRSFPRSRTPGGASTLVAGLVVGSLLLGACGGADAIESEPDDKDVMRGRPSWQEPGAQAPVPATPVVLDAGTDAASKDAAVTGDAGTSDAAVDAGSDAASPNQI